MTSSSQHFRSSKAVRSQPDRTNPLPFVDASVLGALRRARRSQVIRAFRAFRAFREFRV